MSFVIQILKMWSSGSPEIVLQALLASLSMRTQHPPEGYLGLGPILSHHTLCPNCWGQAEGLALTPSGTPCPGTCRGPGMGVCPVGRGRHAAGRGPYH